MITSTTLRECVQTFPRDSAQHCISFYVACINQHNHFFLDAIDGALNEHEHDDAKLAKALKIILADNWTKIKNTALSYTAQPNSPMSMLCCDIATFVARHMDLLIINVLMPTVNVSSLVPEKYPNLDDIDIKSVLRTHIIGEQGQYLIPVKYIIDEDVLVYNPYYDLFNDAHATMVHLNEDELGRLALHSSLTREVCAAKKALESIVTDSNNLLGQLSNLTRHMYYNSAHGFGLELSAGDEFFMCIYNFLLYYDGLDEASIARVPVGIQHEIARIRKYSSIRNSSIDACIAERRRALVSAMQGQELVLQNIGLSTPAHLPLLEEAKKRVSDAKNRLLIALHENNYNEGFDKCAMPLCLIEQLGVAIEFKNFNDLEHLKWISIAELDAFCSDDKYRPLIIDVIGSLDKLSPLVHPETGFSSARLKVFLKGLGDCLTPTSYHLITHYVAITILLNREQQTIFWEQYASKLMDSMASFQLEYIWDVLTKSQQTEVYEAVLTKIATGTFLHSYNDAIYMIRDLKPEWRLGILNAFNPKKMPNFDGLLSTDQLKSLYADLKERLSALPSHGEKFINDSFALYLVEYIKLGAQPAIKKYGYSSYNSSSAFFAAMSAPVMFSMAALGALVSALYYLVKALINLMCLNFDRSLCELKNAFLIISMAFLLTSMAAVMPAVMMIRIVITAGALIMSVCEPSQEPSIEAVELNTIVTI